MTSEKVSGIQLSMTDCAVQVFESTYYFLPSCYSLVIFRLTWNEPFVNCKMLLFFNRFPFPITNSLFWSAFLFSALVCSVFSYSPLCLPLGRLILGPDGRFELIASKDHCCQMTDDFLSVGPLLFAGNIATLCRMRATNLGRWFAQT